MSQQLPQEKTVAFAGHKCDKLQKGLYDADALDKLTLKLEKTISELYDQGFTRFIYSPNDKFGLMASEALSNLQKKHGDIIVSTIPESINHQYYNVIKYFIENASVVVYCDGEKEQPDVEIMNKM